MMLYDDERLYTSNTHVAYPVCIGVKIVNSTALKIETTLPIVFVLIKDERSSSKRDSSSKHPHLFIHPYPFHSPPSHRHGSSFPLFHPVHGGHSCRPRRRNARAGSVQQLRCESRRSDGRMLPRPRHVQPADTGADPLCS